MDEPRLGGPILATSIEFSTRFSNRNATRLQLVPRSKYHSCVIDPLEFKIRILQPSNWLGQGTLGLSLPGPSSLLAHLPVPALPPLGVCRGRGPLPDPLFIENCRQLCTTPNYTCRDEGRDIGLWGLYYHHMASRTTGVARELNAPLSRVI